jgi:hypothetical protein
MNNNINLKFSNYMGWIRLDLLKLKKPLAMLFVIIMICTTFALAVNGQQGQQYQGAPQTSAGSGGVYALPGLPGITIGQGTNTIALSVSIASQQDTQTYFQVNSFAILDPQSQAGTLYTLSEAVPGIMDSSDNQIQLDITQLQSSIQSTSQVSMSDLYTTLRPSVNTLMVIAQASQQSTQGSQAIFQVQSLTIITPDGQATPFNLNSPMSIVVDSSAMRVFTVAFQQLYDFVNSFITSEENNGYTTVINNIVYQPVIVVSPTVVYPIVTPITFPTTWPIYYPVPVRVPIPVVTVKPRPPKPRPTASPIVNPSAAPTLKPTVSPTRGPSVAPTIKPTFSPRPTGIVSIKPTVAPTTGPITSVRPTAGGGRPTYRPTKTPVASYRPSTGGGTPIGTYKPVTTYRPPVSGGGGAVMPTKPVTRGFRPTNTPPAIRRLTELLTPGDLITA